MKFLKANIYRRYNHFDEAIPIFQDILDHHRQHETAEYSANLLLDTYNRMNKIQDMVALTDKLRRRQGLPRWQGRAQAAPGHAQGPVRSARSSRTTEKTGVKDGDYAKLVKCGQGYLEIYNANPESPTNDEVLYNAGVCFEEGKSIGAAIIAFNNLQKFYPQSKLASRAIARLGKAYCDISFYDRASDQLEEYAKTYAGEKDAYDAMNDAVCSSARASAMTRRRSPTPSTSSTLFAKTRPQDAANAMFALTSVYEKTGDGDAVIKHLRAYIQQFGGTGGADRLVVAYTKIGLALWHQSCPTKEVDGSCMKVQRDRALSAKNQAKKKVKANEQPTQCGDNAHAKVTMVTRDATKVAQALAAFKAATGEFEKRQGKTGGDEGGARYYYAQAKFIEADKDFEGYIALQFPQGLNFDPNNKAIKERSDKRLDEWVNNKVKLAGTTNDKYNAIAQIKDAANSIARGRPRGSRSRRTSADALFTAGIPQDVRTGEFADDKVEAFCDRLTEVADPLEKKSLDAYGICLGKSTELGWFSEWSKLCERELGQIKPDEYPTVSELRAEPNAVAPVTDVELPAAKIE